ncbi:hypothetical protein AVW11_11945 [Streptomyces amritsarensis]|uniref:Secreted protein n=1 Tax=Streptomyces amritsarensis TaxID=681158 RepID=A0ABX3G813_9ACTN|nr:hypothetical protein [Streptomyces amritsarensis]OLZ68720.1 hypothetical protein AVW11_11945 [Streptomyces amritsarensis]
MRLLRVLGLNGVLCLRGQERLLARSARVRVGQLLGHVEGLSLLPQEGLLGLLRLRRRDDRLRRVRLLELLRMLRLLGRWVGLVRVPGLVGLPGAPGRLRLRQRELRLRRVRLLEAVRPLRLPGLVDPLDLRAMVKLTYGLRVLVLVGEVGQVVLLGLLAPRVTLLPVLLPVPLLRPVHRPPPGRRRRRDTVARGGTGAGVSVGHGAPRGRSAGSGPHSALSIRIIR